MIKIIDNFNYANGSANVYELTGCNGVSVKISEIGARILEINCPDKNGYIKDITVGRKTAEDYVTGGRSFYGTTVGRYANRIGGGAFTLNGKTYELDKNENGNTLHGGTEGFDVKKFTGEIKGEQLVLTYFSADKEQGFPGNMLVKVKYELKDSEIIIKYYAISDRDTVCNFTNHAYFNISNRSDALGCEVKINAEKITEVDGDLLATGKLADIKNTDLDFRKGAVLKDRVNSDNVYIAKIKGFDFNYCVNEKNDKELREIASVYDSESGRELKIKATMPGVQFYFCKGVGNFDGKIKYPSYAGLCLEPQFYPNSPNFVNFPSATLKAGETYEQTIVFALGIK